MQTSPKASPQSLFADEQLDHWEPTAFGGEGRCLFENGIFTLEAGQPLTGITSAHPDLPVDDYEISLEARRVEGTDFFCGLTFPVEQSHATLVVGGWAGRIIGISSIDGLDASQNETRVSQKFDRDRWYKIRLRVQNKHIAAWIDDRPVIDIDITGRKISLRTETFPCRPLGVCCFDTMAQLRNFTLLRLPENEAHEP